MASDSSDAKSQSQSEGHGKCSCIFFLCLPFFLHDWSHFAALLLLLLRFILMKAARLGMCVTLNTECCRLSFLSALDKLFVSGREEGSSRRRRKRRSRRTTLNFNWNPFEHKQSSDFMQFQILPDPASAPAPARARARVAASNDCSCKSFAKQLWLKDKAAALQQQQQPRIW